jgi:undecaprenyl-diphosphatase
VTFPDALSLRLRSPKKVLVVCLGLTGAVVLTVAAFFGHYPPGDVAISRAVQSVHFTGISELSDFVYRTGVFPWLQALWLGAAACLFLLRHRLMAAFLVLGLLAQNFAFLIKIIVERPRPSPLLVEVARTSESFSFPSGHVMGAVLFWGLMILAAQQVIANRSARLFVQGASVTMIVLMGLQRVYAGAHWPTDVLAAYLWGGLILFALAYLFRLCCSYTAQEPVPVRDDS